MAIIRRLAGNRAGFSAIWGLCGALGLAGCTADGGPGPVDGTEEPDPANFPPEEPPARSAAHGALLDGQGRPVPPSVEVALATQAYFIARLLGEAEPDVMAEFEERRLEANDVDGLTPEGRVAVHAELLEWLLLAVNPADAANLLNLNGALRRMFRPRGEAGDVGVAAQEITTTTSTRGQSYVDTCLAAGVPTPPPWRSSQWVRRGTLSPDFLQSTPTADVYTFNSTSPRGLCIALPRINGSNIPFLGIICQGNDTSKACFWDSDADATITTTGTAQLPIVGPSFVGGNDLIANDQGVCSDCHAGENAFNVHPGSALDRGAALQAKGWVNPLVPPSWPQNRRPGRDLDLLSLGSGQQSCVSCHNKANHTRLPRLKETSRQDYCLVVATIALQRTMPMGQVGSTAFSTHANAIRSGCGSTPTPAARFGPSTKAHDSFSANLEYPFMGDFNDDGRADILTMVFGSARDVWVALSNGSTFNTSSKWHDDFDGSTGGSTVGDFNGDGKDDLVLVYDSSDAYDVALSSGASFGAKTRFWSGSQAIYGQREAGDVNNDGKDDIIIFGARTTASATSAEVWVQLSTGSGFGNAVLWRVGFAAPNVRYDVGDFNGDGFDDIVRFDGGTTGDVFVAVSNGSNFEPATMWHSWFAPSGEMPRVGDVNADGFDDIITFTRGTASDVFVATSSGTSFNGTGVLWHGTFGTGSQWVRAGDIDGDGDADATLFTQGTAMDVFVAKAVP